MGSTVHQPGYVQDETPAEHGGHEPGIDEGLTPKVHGDGGRHDEAQNRHQDHVVLLLEHQDGIGTKIG